MPEQLLQRIMFEARRPDGYWSRAKIVIALKRAYEAGRGRRRAFDAHAIREAAKLLDEQAVSLNFALQRPGCEERLARWMRQPRRLRNRQTSLMHIEEMERRLRRMLKR